MSDLPCEITEQILLKLPARSVLRFRLVCKQWRSLILDPKFVKDHANNVISDQSSHKHKVITWITGERLKKKSKEESTKFEYWIQSISLESINYELPNSPIFEPKFPTPSTPEIFRCCNGLWLLMAHSCSFVLWNPLLGQNYKSLPESNFDSLLYKSCSIGFGYAPSIDEYKVVRLFRKKSDIYYPRCYSELEVEIYSSKTNSWKIIPGVPPTNIAYNYYEDSFEWTEEIHVNGYIYWYIYDSGNALVFAFDLNTEKFKLLEPPSLDADSFDLIEMLQVRGCLGAYQYACDSEGNLIWIWNEDENKKGGYWTKLLTIPNTYPMLTHVLSFLNDNQVVLLDTGDRSTDKLVMYDSACMMFKDIPCRYFGWPLLVMVETLLSPLSL